MADTDQEQSQKHKDHSSEKSIEPRNDTDNSPKHREDASAPNQACRYEAQQPPNIIIQRDKPDDTQAVRANTIANRMFIASIAGSIISLGVLVATFFIWKATQDSVQVAHDALADSHTKDSTASVNEKVAQGRQDSTNRAFLNKASQSAEASTASANALLEWKDIGRENYELSRSVFDSTVSANKASIAISQKVLQAQIDALEKAQKNFQTQNEPYLQIGAPTFDTPGVTKQFSVSFEVQNLGNYPAKIVAEKLKFEGCELPPIANSFSYPEDDTLYLIDKYVTKENPIKSGISADSVFFDKRNDSLMKTGKLKVYFWGYIQYVNLVTKLSRIYTFKIMIDTKPGEKGRFIWNENRDIPAKDSGKIYHLGAWDDPMFSDAFK